MPVAELRVAFRPLRASAVLMAGYVVARHGQQVSELAAGYQPYATLPGRTDPLPPTARLLERGAVVRRAIQAAPANQRPAAMAAATAGRRPVEAPAFVARGLPAMHRPEERGARVEGGPIAALRPRERGAERGRDGPLALRPIKRGGQAAPSHSAGVRPQERDGLWAGPGPAAGRPRYRAGRADGGQDRARRPNLRPSVGAIPPVHAARERGRKGGEDGRRVGADRVLVRPGWHGGGSWPLTRDQRRQSAWPWRLWLPDRDRERVGWADWPRWELADRIRGEVIVVWPRLWAVRTDPRPVMLVADAPWAVRQNARAGDWMRAARGADARWIIRGPMLAWEPALILARSDRGRHAGAVLTAYTLGERPTSLGASVLPGGWAAGMRRPELAARMLDLAMLGTRPTGLGGAVFGRVATGRGGLRGAVLVPVRTGLRDATPGAVVVPTAWVAAVEARREATVLLGRVASARDLLRDANIVVGDVALMKAPKPAILPWLWLARTAPRRGVIVPGRRVDKAPKPVVLPRLWPAGRPPLEALVLDPQELLWYNNPAPYVPRPEDNERPYDPAEPWPETEPVDGPINPPPPPQTDPETGEPIPPPPQEHVEPPPNAIVDPETGEPRYPTGGTDPATGDPEILPPSDPTGIDWVAPGVPRWYLLPYPGSYQPFPPRWITLPYPGSSTYPWEFVRVPEGTLREVLKRFWDIWKSREVYYSHIPATEAIRDLLAELIWWGWWNPYDAGHWAVIWEIVNCAREAVMRYCRTYLRRRWGEVRHAVLDYGTDALNTGRFQDPSRWTVDGWRFDYHLREGPDIALAPDRDGAAVTLACNLPYGGLVDFEHLEAQGNTMRLVALPSGQVLWQSTGQVEDPYGTPGPHARVEVPEGTTGLRWEFEWGAGRLIEQVDYGEDVFNDGRPLDPSRWTTSGWDIRLTRDPTEPPYDYAWVPLVDGGWVRLAANLSHGGRAEFEYGVATGNTLELVAEPSGQVIWTAGGTADDPYGFPGPRATVAIPAGTTAIRWRFRGTAVPPSGLRAYIDVLTVYRYDMERTAPASGLAGILDVITLWRYEMRRVLLGAWAETVCEPNSGNRAVQDTWDCIRRKWEERHQEKTLRRMWLVT